MSELQRGLAHDFPHPRDDRASGKGYGARRFRTLRCWIHQPHAERTVKSARRKAEAALTAALSCPDGFKLVPVEPTPEMLKAYSMGLKNYISTFDAAERQARWGSPKKGRGFELPEWEKAIARYRAMLAASPAPAPQPISQDQDRG